MIMETAQLGEQSEPHMDEFSDCLKFDPIVPYAPNDPLPSQGIHFYRTDAGIAPNVVHFYSAV